MSNRRQYLQVAMFVASDVSVTFRLTTHGIEQGLFAHGLNQPFGQHDNSVVRAFRATLDDRRGPATSRRCLSQGRFASP